MSPSPLVNKLQSNPQPMAGTPRPTPINAASGRHNSSPLAGDTAPLSIPMDGEVKSSSQPGTEEVGTPAAPSHPGLWTALYDSLGDKRAPWRSAAQLSHAASPCLSSTLLFCRSHRAGVAGIIRGRCCPRDDPCLVTAGRGSRESPGRGVLVCMSQRVRPDGRARPPPTRHGRAPHGSAYRAQTTAASHGPGSSRRGAEDTGRRSHPSTVSEGVLSSGGRHSRAEEERDPFEDVLRDPAALNPICASFRHCEGSAVARTRDSTSVLQRIRDVSQPLSYNKRDARVSLSSPKPKLGDSLKTFHPPGGDFLKTFHPPGDFLPAEELD